MGGDPQAFAVLGLEPGATLDDVERAYKRLIKTHHPDRDGGDAVRASELNRAYRDLRIALRRRDDFSVRPVRPEQAPGWSRTVWALVIIAVLGCAALALMLLSPREAARMVGLKAPAAVAPRADIMDQPINPADVDSAVLSAVRLAKTSDEMAMAAHSNACFTALRRAPTLAAFDRCAAFDDAVIRLQDRDPLRDQGPFGEIAATGRLWNSAADLSDDYLATDLRLRRIRNHVEAMLSPADPSSAER